METKPVYKSVTFWGVVLTAAIEAAERAGALPGGIGVMIAQFVTLAVTLFGRFRATKPLSVT
jgi:hypothetical protein